MIKLFFVGDVVHKKRNKDIKLIGQELQEIINEHDIKCCNLEAPVISENNKPDKILKIGPSLYQDEESAKEIVNSGFNMFSLANNHIMDYGMEGLENTKKILEGNVFIGAGTTNEEVYKTYIYEKEGIKVGFLSVAENGFGICDDSCNEVGVAWFLNEKVEEKIRKLKQECDYVILNCHAGAELFELPLPEIRQLYKKFIDYGADIIIGHHPHIIQGYETYKKGIIFYSLGNFIFPTLSNPNDEWKKSYCVSLELDKEDIKWKVIPTIFENGQVDLDKSQNSLTNIQELSKKINSEEYIKRVNKFCIEKYNNIYKNYYLSYFNINRNGIINKIKSCIKMIFNLRKDNEAMLYHNLAIETHLWICKRALKLIMEREEKRRC